MTGPEPELSDTDYFLAALADWAIEELDKEALVFTTWNAVGAEQFFAVIQAAVELNDIVKDHYDK